MISEAKSIWFAWLHMDIQEDYLIIVLTDSDSRLRQKYDLPYHEHLEKKQFYVVKVEQCKV